MTAAAPDLQALAGDGAPSVPAPRARWATRVLVPVVILLVMLGLLVVTSLDALAPSVDVRVVPVVTKSVEGGAASVTVQAPGWLEPDPHPSYIAALADGVVESVTVLEGDPVAAGQVVATLVDDDARLALARADAEHRRRTADVAAADAEVEAARLRLEHLVEPTRAAALAAARADEARARIAKVQADVVVEVAKLAELRDEYDRKSKLVESQAIAEASVARLRLRVDAQAATVEAVRAEATVLAATLAQAEADRVAARTDLDLLIDERRAVALAEASLASSRALADEAAARRDEAALRLERMAVRSPVDGIVLRRLVVPGSTIARNGTEHAAHVVHVYDPAHLQVRVDVPLADAAHIAVGQAVEVTVEVLPDRTFAGRVTRIVHEADIQKNTVEAKVAIDAPSAELKPEMLARARFLARQAPESGGAMRERVFVPERLVRDGRVLVVTGLTGGRGRVAARAVTLGVRRIDDWIEVEEGLAPGALLVADPPDGLADGARVRVTGEGGGS